MKTPQKAWSVSHELWSVVTNTANERSNRWPRGIWESGEQYRKLKNRTTNKEENNSKEQQIADIEKLPWNDFLNRYNLSVYFGRNRSCVQTIDPYAFHTIFESFHQVSNREGLLWTRPFSPYCWQCTCRRQPSGYSTIRAQFLASFCLSFFHLQFIFFRISALALMAIFVMTGNNVPHSAIYESLRVFSDDKFFVGFMLLWNVLL